MTATTLAPATLTPQAAFEELRTTLRALITNQPRSRQRQIGPSELGNPCDHCLAARLAGWERHDRGTPWLTVIGTALHQWIDDQIQLNHIIPTLQTGGVERWRTEARVTVGTILGQPVTGSTDLLDLAARMTVDWKLVGESTLRKAKVHGPSGTYRAQAHLYAKGWNDEGIPVEHVSIVYLPRNDVIGLDHALFWTEPYDPTIATAALARAESFATNLAVLATISDQARDQWITSLPREDGCWDCPKYPDYSSTGRQDSLLDGLTTTQ